MGSEMCIRDSRCGRPLVLAWVWWRYLLTGLVVLFSQGRSRLSMFLWEWRSFGSGDYFYHGEGIWCWKYPQVEEITRSHQDRKAVRSTCTLALGTAAALLIRSTFR
mgnify:CR=1 FL=1